MTNTRYANLTQATYDRILGRIAARAPQTALDVRDLLRAYEDAVTLLDKLAFDHEREDVAAAEDFLFTESGDPRVELRDEAPFGETST